MVGGGWGASLTYIKRPPVAARSVDWGTKREDCHLERQLPPRASPQVLEWLGTAAPDLLALQEIKLTDDQFPAAELEAAGYRAVWSGQSYNFV